MIRRGSNPLAVADLVPARAKNAPSRSQVVDSRMAYPDASAIHARHTATIRRAIVVAGCRYDDGKPRDRKANLVDHAHLKPCPLFVVDPLGVRLDGVRRNLHRRNLDELVASLMSGKKGATDHHETSGEETTRHLVEELLVREAFRGRSEGIHQGASQHVRPVVVAGDAPQNPACVMLVVDLDRISTSRVDGRDDDEFVVEAGVAHGAGTVTVTSFDQDFRASHFTYSRTRLSKRFSMERSATKRACQALAMVVKRSALTR